MKTKKMKLTLNKRTISNLGNKKMQDVVGGAPSWNTLCETWGPGSCGVDCFSFDPPAICPDVTWYTECGC
jgi:hypothetical protein